MNTSETTSLGKRIRLAREETGLSRNDLADKAGCSADYLEWIETGQVDPPVSLLIQLAKALGLDTGTFLKDDVSQQQTLKEEPKKTKHYLYRTLTPPDEERHLKPFGITIPPKTVHEGVGYQHEGEEYVYVLSGEVEIMIDDQKRLLTEKESIRFN